MKRSKSAGGRVPPVVRQMSAVDFKWQTIEIDDPEALAGGQTLPRRTARFGGELPSLLFPDATTIPHSFRSAAASSPEHPALSMRQWAGGQWRNYESLSYGALSTRVDNFGSGLRKLGLRSGDPLVLWAENCAEWVVASLGAFAHSLVIVPIRPDVSIETARHIIKDSKAKVIVCSNRAWLEAALKKCKKVSHAVTIVRSGPRESSGESDGAELEERKLGKCKLHPFDEVEKNGAENQVKAILPDASSPAVIAYTQGVSGPPKGAELAHAALVAAHVGLAPILGDPMAWTVDSDVYYANTTFASMFHFSLLFTLIACRANIGIPSLHDELSMIDDIEALRPTIFSGTPELYQRLHTRLMQVVARANPAKKWMFKKGYRSKNGNQADGLGHTFIWDKLVFNSFKACLGGRIRLFLSTDHPLCSSTRSFLQICFGCRVVEVYTLTEAAGIVCATHPSDPASLHVGSPIGCLELKLVDDQRLGFSTKDNPPSGEICIRGMSLAQRYLDDALTSATFEEDGWFHTGDIGFFNENGTLTLLDRKENFVMLQGGKSVPLGRLESLYAQSQFVKQIYVYGESTEPCLVAVVQVNPSILSSFANNPGVRNQFEGESDPKALSSNRRMRQVVVAELRAIGKSLGLAKHELIWAVHLEIGEWTVEESLETPSKRLRRDALRAKYAETIAGLYAELKDQAIEAIEVCQEAAPCAQ